MRKFFSFLAMQSHFYLSEDNLNLHYLSFGDSENPKLCLLLHGFTNDAHIFDGLSKQLSETHRVISVDFRGHGDSDWDSNCRYSHDQLVNDIQRLIDSLEFEQLHIIGHSLGARVAILLLGRNQPEITTLSIIDTGPEVRAMAVDKVRKDAEATPKSFSSVASYRDFLSNIYFLAESDRIDKLAEYGLKSIEGKLCPKTDPAFTQALWKPDSKQGNSNDLRYPLNEELWQQLSRIYCPTLVLKGQASAILANRTAEKMVNDYLAKGQFKIIERAGHAVMVDNPAQYESVQIDFVQSHS
jgi:pimeloyl-ACP methyl ester carboxylesterase